MLVSHLFVIYTKMLGCHARCHGGPLPSKSDVAIKIAPMFPALPNIPNMQLVSNAYILLHSNVRDSQYFSRSVMPSWSKKMFFFCKLALLFSHSHAKTTSSLRS
jgi:hypothetical protein